MLGPLQSVSDWCYFNNGPMGCLVSQYAGAFGGEALFGVLMGSVIFTAFYVASDGDMATPTVAVILCGTALIPMVPPRYGQIGMYVVTIGLAAAVWQVLQKYVLSPATQ